MRSFHSHTENCRSSSSILHFCQFLPGDGQQMLQIALRNDRHPEILYRIPALNNGVFGAADSVIESSDRLFGAPGKMVASSLHLDQGSLKALQQRIVQVTGDARTLRQALIEACT